MKHPRRSIPLLCLAILLGAVALGAAAHTSTSASSSRLSQAADDVHTLHQLLGSARVDTILSGQQPAALEDLDTSQLEALFNALGDEESYSLEESEQAGAIQAKIAAILNLRTQDLPPETTPEQEAPAETAAPQPSQSQVVGPGAASQPSENSSGGPGAAPAPAAEGPGEQ